VALLYDDSYFLGLNTNFYIMEGATVGKSVEAQALPLWCIQIYLVIFWGFFFFPFCLLILSSSISPFVTSSLLPFCSGLEYLPFHILDQILKVSHFYLGISPNKNNNEIKHSQRVSFSFFWTQALKTLMKLDGNV